MKKTLMLLVAAGFAMLAGCATVGTQTPAQIAANLHVQVVKACAVATPTILSLNAMKPQMTAVQAADLDKASTIVAEVCAAPAAPITSAQDFVNVAVPAAIKIISASSLKDSDKVTAEIALTAASVAVSAALAQYAPAAPVPASGVTAS